MFKVVVLYPPPTDPAAFEAAYHGQHMPLMHWLVGDTAALPTFKVIDTGRAPPFYRMAEIHFADRAALDAFIASDATAVGGRSLRAVSTGGAPIVFVCEGDPLL